MHIRRWQWIITITALLLFSHFFYPQKQNKMFRKKSLKMEFIHIAYKNKTKPKTRLNPRREECRLHCNGQYFSACLRYWRLNQVLLSAHSHLLWFGQALHIKWPARATGQQLLSTGNPTARTDSFTQGLSPFSLENCPTSCHRHVVYVRREEEHE